MIAITMLVGALIFFLGALAGGVVLILLRANRVRLEEDIDG
jgi:hypothetical protein